MTQGDAAQAQALCDRFGAPFPCLADPSREGYRTYGLKRGSVMEVMGPAAILRGARAASKGHFVERVRGDAFQMPGTFIIDRDGLVRYTRYARHSADHPSVEELIVALAMIREGERESPHA